VFRFYAVSRRDVPWPRMRNTWLGASGLQNEKTRLLGGLRFHREQFKYTKVL